MPRTLLALGLGIFLIAAGAALPGGAAAQTPPLTIDVQTERVGVRKAAPAYPLDVDGTVNATSFRGDGSQLTNVPGGVWTQTVKVKGGVASELPVC
jgi:hypothetical protein